MANKPQLNNIVQISNNEEAALRLLNKNFDTLNGVIQDYVSRSGEVPTQMQTVLDMGDKRIVNVGKPVDPKDAARLEDVGDAVAASEAAAASAQEAANSATRAAGSEANAAASASAARGYYENTLAMYDPYIKYVYDNRTIYETIYNIRDDITNVATHLYDLVWNLSTADKTKSLTILGTPTTEVGNINIGLYSSATGYASVAIGPGATADNYGAAYGAYANATGGHSTAMGCGYNSNTGARATGSYSVAVGNESLASGNYSTALGVLANATAAGAIQIGKGTNNTANTLEVGLNNTNYTLLKDNGQVPEERLEEIMIKGSSDPTSSTPGTVGLLYKNTASGKLFICISASPNSAWEEVGTSAGGGTAEVYTNPSLTSSGGECTWAINHTIGSRDILVEVYNTTTYEQAVCTIARTSDNVVTVKFVSSANIGAGAYKAVLAASSAYGTGVFTLNQAADTYISSPTNGDVLVYNDISGLWENTKTFPGSYTFTGNVVLSGNSSLTSPYLAKQTNTTEGGQINFESADAELNTGKPMFIDRNNGEFRFGGQDSSDVWRIPLEVSIQYNYVSAYNLYLKKIDSNLAGGQVSFNSADNDINVGHDITLFRYNGTLKAGGYNSINTYYEPLTLDFNSGEVTLGKLGGYYGGALRFEGGPDEVNTGKDIRLERYNGAFRFYGYTSHMFAKIPLKVDIENDSVTLARTTLKKIDNYLEGGQIDFEGADYEPNYGKNCWIDRHNGRIRIGGYDSSNVAHNPLEVDIENNQLTVSNLYLGARNSDKDGGIVLFNAAPNEVNYPKNLWITRNDGKLYFSGLDSSGVNKTPLVLDIQNDTVSFSTTSQEYLNRQAIPNYSAGVSISTGYVAPSNGYVTVVRGSGSSGVCLYVDGVQVDSNESNTSNEGGTIAAFVAKGSTVTWTTGNISSSTFFPLIGG